MALKMEFNPLRDSADPSHQQNSANISEESLHQCRQKIAFTDRTSSLGELTSAIAHEINQPFAVIANYLHGCIRRLESGNYQVSDLIHALGQAVKQSQLTSDIIHRLKNFSCKSALNYKPECINSVIAESVSLLKHEAEGFPVGITFKPITHPPLIVLDLTHIQQVVTSLARNAIEAMREANTKSPALKIEAELVSETSVEIRVIDNGPGIADAISDKLFTPHFSTKPNGAGLSLAVCRTIVEAHGGQISFYSNPNGGTCFRFTLSTNMLNPSSSHFLRPNSTAVIY